MNPNRSGFGSFGASSSSGGHSAGGSGGSAGSGNFLFDIIRVSIENALLPRRWQFCLDTCMRMAE